MPLGTPPPCLPSPIHTATRASPVTARGQPLAAARPECQDAERASPRAGLRRGSFLAWPVGPLQGLSAPGGWADVVSHPLSLTLPPPHRQSQSLRKQKEGLQRLGELGVYLRGGTEARARVGLGFQTSEIRTTQWPPGGWEQPGWGQSPALPLANSAPPGKLSEVPKAVPSTHHSLTSLCLGLPARRVGPSV